MIRKMLANHLKTQCVEIIQRSHHTPNPTMPCQTPPFPQTQLFLRPPVLHLKTPHHHPVRNFRRLLSTARSRTGLDQTISTPLRTLYLQIQHGGPHPSGSLHTPPIARSRNGLNPMFFNPLQILHPHFPRSYRRMAPFQSAELLPISR